MAKGASCVLLGLALFVLVSPGPAVGFMPGFSSLLPALGLQPRTTRQWMARGNLIQLSRSATNINGGNSDGLSEPVKQDEITDPSHLPDVETRISRIVAEIGSRKDEISAVGGQIRDIEDALEAGKSYQGISDPNTLFQERMTLRQSKMKLRQLEEQLRQNLLQEKEQVRPRKKRISVFPDTYQVSKGLLEFGENLAKSKLENQVFELPEGVYFLGDVEHGHSFFIREEFNNIRDIIFSVVEKGIRNIVVNGSTGAGKSIFNFYLLYFLRLEGKTVLFNYKELWYRFSDEGVEAAETLNTWYNTRYLGDYSGWLLCDPVSEPTEAFQGVTVVVVSPTVARANQFIKQGKYKGLHMDIWSLEELQKCRDLVYPHVPKDYVDRAFKIAGGNARVAFDTTKLDIFLKEMPRSSRGMTLRHYENAVSGWGDVDSFWSRKISDKFFHYTVVESENSDFRTVWASEYAATLAFQAMGKRGAKFVESFLATCLESSQTNATKTLRDIFLKKAHDSLGQTGTSYRRYKLSDGNEIGPVSFPFSRRESFMDKNIPRFLKPNTYYVPKQQHFEGIDALGIDDNGVLYLFQMESGEIRNPSISLEGKSLDVLRNACRYMDGEIRYRDGRQECIHIFVVPDIKGRDVDANLIAMFDGVNAKEEKRKSGADPWPCTATGDFFRISDVWVIGMPIQAYPMLNTIEMI